MRRPHAFAPPRVKSIIAWTVAAAAAALLVTVACVSDRQKAGGPTGVVEGECRIPIGSPILGSTQALVAIRNFSFNPETVHVKRGTTVTWVNCEPTNVDSHTTTSEANAWQSPFLPPGSTYSHTFDAAGQFGYFCIPHPFMRGAVVVE